MSSGIDVGADRVEARRRLLALPGIGPWTSEYIAMRALRDPDAFLPSDLGVPALERLEPGRPPGERREARGALAAICGAYAVQHLWASL